MTDEKALREVAVHEAGHIVVAAHLGCWLFSAWIKPGQGQTMRHGVSEPRETLLIALAGQVAVDGARNGLEWGSTDLQQILASLKKIAPRSKKKQAEERAKATAMCMGILAEYSDVHKILVEWLLTKRSVDLSVLGIGKSFFDKLRTDPQFATYRSEGQACVFAGRSS
jgi:hypothetical protein